MGGGVKLNIKPFTIWSFTIYHLSGYWFWLFSKSAAKIHIFSELRKVFGRKINFARHFAGLGMVCWRFYPVASSVLKIVC